MDKLVYTAKEASKVLNIGTNKIYELLYQRQIPCIKVGRRYLIPKSSLESWLNETVGIKQ
ncbi:MAG TPA: helix-turn-helix domain-containing protein [Patescibacteria group bacterium]|nr:helix-turn-helix domain-containing protein [Patescibacteria group bacterium]